MRTEKLHRINKWTVTACALVCLGALIALFFVSLRGNHTIDGGYPEDFVSDSISCEINNFMYPFFSSYKEAPLRQTTKVNIIFDDNNINAISLMHIMYWSSTEKSLTSHSFNHADMNKSFGAASLGADALGANYTYANDRSIMSLYATTDEINPVTLKYFLVSTATADKKDSSWYEEQYKKQGFTCQHNN